MSPQVGDRFGSFTIEGVIGRGGMGVVFLARDDRLNRPVAIKVMAAEMLAEPTDRARFEREARAAASVIDANVVRVHSCGVEGGLPYLVMEYLDGGSLADRLRREGRLTPTDVARVGAQMARGLAAVHAAGLVHRDLKPANVLLGADGAAKLTDFGLARPARSGSSERLTQTGEVVGTPTTISPEQALGDAVDARSDLYSLGATLFMLVTGEPLFPGDGIAVLARHVRETPRSPASVVPDLPQPLAELILDLLEKRPEDRPASAAEVARRLEALGPAPSAPASRRRARWLRVAVPLGLSGALAAIVAHSGSSSRPGPPSSKPSLVPSETLAPPASRTRGPGSPEPSPAPRVDLPDFARPFAHGTYTYLRAVLGSPRAAAEPLEQAEIRSLARSPDGSRVVAGHLGGRVTVWDLAAARVVASASIDDSHANAVAYVADGRSIFVTSNSRSNWLWSPGEEPRPLGALPTAQHGVTGLGDDGAVTTDLRGQLAFWDLTARAPVGTYDVSVNAYNVCAAADGRLVLAGQGGMVVVFDLVRRETQAVVQPHVGDVPALAVAPSGRRFITGGGDGNLLLWDVASFGPDAEPVYIRRAPFQIQIVGFDAVAFLDERRAVSCARSGAVELWDLGTEPPRVLETLDLSRAADRGSAIVALPGASGFLVATARGVIYHFALSEK